MGVTGGVAVVYFRWGADVRWMGSIVSVSSGGSRISSGSSGSSGSSSGSSVGRAHSDDGDDQ